MKQILWSKIEQNKKKRSNFFFLSSKENSLECIIESNTTMN